MFCENCGAKVPANSKFCVSCGTKIEGQVAGTTTAQPTAPIPPPPPVASPAPATPTSPPPPASTPAAGVPSSSFPGYTPAAPSPPAPSAGTGPTTTQIPRSASSQSHAPRHSYGAKVEPGSEPLSVGQYIGILLLMVVPILNIILLFVWSFGSSANLNRKNFARASLILAAIMFIFWIIAGGAIMGSLMGGFY